MGAQNRYGKTLEQLEEVLRHAKSIEKNTHLNWVSSFIKFRNHEVMKVMELIACFPQRGDGEVPLTCSLGTQQWPASRISRPHKAWSLSPITTQLRLASWSSDPMYGCVSPSKGHGGAEPCTTNGCYFGVCSSFPLTIEEYLQH